MTAAANTAGHHPDLTTRAHRADHLVCWTKCLQEPPLTGRLLAFPEVPTSTMAPAPILVSPADAAALLRRPVGTIKRWASAGENRITSYGGRYDWRELAPVAQGLYSVPPRRSAA